MLNSATLAVILLYILSAILFTSTTVSIAIYYARKKADTEEKTLITKNDYKKNNSDFFNYKLHCIICRNGCCTYCRLR